MLTKLTNGLRKGRRRMTGLSVVVLVIALASVGGLVGYAVGSPQSSTVSVYGGMDDKGSPLQLRGAVIAKGDDVLDAANYSCVTELVFTVALSEGSEPVNFIMAADSDADGALSGDVMTLHTVMIAYVDHHQRVNDLAWRFDEYGPGDGDSLLEAGENFRIRVGADKDGHADLLDDALNPDLGTDTKFCIEVIPPVGETLIIQRTTPSTIDAVMNLR